MNFMGWYVSSQQGYVDEQELGGAWGEENYFERDVCLSKCFWGEHNMIGLRWPYPEQGCATLHSPFQVFLKYLYTGKIQVDYANVIPILQLADKYNVKDLLRWPMFIVFWTKDKKCFFAQGRSRFHVQKCRASSQEKPGNLHFWNICI